MLWPSVQSDADHHAHAWAVPGKPGEVEEVGWGKEVGERENRTGKERKRRSWKEGRKIDNSTISNGYTIDLPRYYQHILLANSFILFPIRQSIFKSYNNKNKTHFVPNT